MAKRGVIAGVAVLGALLGGAAVVDAVMRDRTEERLATNLESEIPGLEGPPDVVIGGWPYLTQVLDGELGDVHVSAAEATLQDLPLERIRVQLHGVSTEEPYRAREAEMTAFVPLEAVQSLPGLDGDLSIEEGQMIAAVPVLGLTLEVAFTPRADGRAVAIDVDSLRMGGATVTADDLPVGLGDQLQGLAFPLTDLPEGVELTDLVVVHDGAEVTAVGTDMLLEVPAPE